MFEWIRRRWPLVWKSTVSQRFDELAKSYAAQIGGYCKRIGEMAGELEKANGRNVRWQRQVAHMAQSRIGADSLLRRIQVIEDDRMAATLIHTPKIELVGYGKGDVLGCSGRGRREEVKLVRFTVDIGLSKEMPPEMLAMTIREQIVDAVLMQWQDQSILEHKE